MDLIYDSKKIADINIGNRVLKVDALIWKKDPFIGVSISTEGEWNDFATKINNGTIAAGTNARLLKDIRFSDNAIAQIGTLQTPYCGIFDGKNHMVEVNRNVNTSDPLGLFGKIKNATIKNIMRRGNTINQGRNSNIGNIVGDVENGIIENCHNFGNVSCPYNSESNGGIVGKITSGSVLKCSNLGNINAPNEVSGIISHIYPSSLVNVFECYNAGIIELSGPNGDYYNMGAIVSTLNVGTAAVIIKDCYNKGTLNNTRDFVGGIVGNDFVSKAELYRNFNIKTVNAVGSMVGGGIIGRGSNNAYRSNYYINSCSKGVGSGRNNHDGLHSISTSDFANVNTFTRDGDSFDFINVWEMDESKGYPVLRNNREK